MFGEFFRGVGGGGEFFFFFFPFARRGPENDEKDKLQKSKVENDSPCVSAMCTPTSAAPANMPKAAGANANVRSAATIAA